MATILLLDTSDAESVAAVSTDGAAKAAKRHTGARDGAAMLNFLVRDVLAEVGLSFHDLNAISVIAGPGSYTGVRVAVAAAKGFCFALGLPLIGHNKLDLLAAGTYSSRSDSDYFITSALPARASEWFAAIYSSTGEAVLTPQHIAEQDLRDAMRKLSGAVHWIGSVPPEGLLSVRQVSNESGCVDIGTWAREAHRRFSLAQFENIASFAPHYLKAPFVALPPPQIP